MAKRLRRRPSFFKVLIGDYSKQLLVPPAFVKHFEASQSRKVYLRSPTRGFWCADLEKTRNGLVFFRDGWEAFVKDHSLELGDFLLFQFDRRSIVDVRIYGRNACEKKFVLSSGKSKQCIGENPRSGKRKREMERDTEHLLEEYIDEELEENIKAEDNEENPCTEKFDGIASNRRKRSKTQGQDIRESAGHLVHNRRPLCIKNQEAIEAARNFTSENPFFEAIATKYNIKRGNANVPRWFTKKTEQRNEFVTIEADGKSWPVKLIQRKNSSGLLSAGWSAFARGNALQVGDVCIFELIKTGDVVIKVSIFRCTAH